MRFLLILLVSTLVVFQIFLPVIEVSPPTPRELTETPTATATFVPTDTPQPTPTATATLASNCDAAYPDFCIAPPPPDQSCQDVGRQDFTVLPPDPHGFDRDGDGVGCESGDLLAGA